MRDDEHRPEVDDAELSAAERDALRALPREADPGDLLLERTVRALRGRGLLRPVAARPAVALTPWRAVAALAAGLGLFLGGLALGGRPVAGPESASTVRPDVQLLLHRSSDYVEALAGLAQQAPAGDPQASARARDVARSTLAAAAEQLVRLAPDDPLAIRILQALEATGAAAPDSTAFAARRVVWF
jgi:hypothetical protein